MKKCVIILCFLTSFQLSFGTNYYVSKTGNDSNSGTSPENSWASLQKSADVMKAGDTCFVGDGTYTEEVKVNHSGNSSSAIVFKSLNKWGAKVTNSWYNCFTIKASYITIDGFELVAPATYGSGVGAMPKDDGSFIHHITVRNNKCHDSGQAGIAVQDCDYITIEYNVCYKNAWLMPYCGSGISIYGRSSYDTKDGFHYIVRGNICYLNDNGPETAMTDGNGIIIDDLRNTQSENHHGLAQDLTYTTQAVLIENNLCYNNGGKGIHMCWSNNITVRNNTVYGNCTRSDQANSDWNGDLSIYFASNVTAVNNICVSTVPNSDAHAIFAGATSGIGVSSNLNFYNNITYSTFNPALPAASGNGMTISVEGVNNNQTATNPMLVDPANVNSPDFHLQAASPAIDAGTTDYGYYFADLDYNTRIVGIIDIGAYEYGGTPVTSEIKYLNVKPVAVRLYDDVLTISQLPDEPCDVFLYSLDGKLITHKKMSNSGELNVSHLSVDIYILKVTGKSIGYTGKYLL